jgi:uncharacterized protein
MYTGGVSRRRSRSLVALCGAILTFLCAAGVGAANAAEPSFSARGSVEQVYVTGAMPGEQLSLVDSAGSTVSTRTVNSLGGALFRSITPGSGYRVRAFDGTNPTR